MRNICDVELIEQSSSTTNVIVEDMDELKKVNLQNELKNAPTEFTSEDSGGGYSEVDTITGSEKMPTLLQKLSKAVSNIRYIWKLLGTTDISSIGDGTMTGGIYSLQTFATKMNNVTIPGITNRLTTLENNNPLEWKTAGATTGTEQIDISNIGDYTELLVTGYYTNSAGMYVLFQTIIAKEQLDNTVQIFNLNGYIYSSTDFGYVSVNASNSYIQLRYAVNAGTICTDTAGLKIRYR